MFEFIGGLKVIIYFLFLVTLLNILDYKYLNLRRKFYKKHKVVKVIGLVSLFILSEALIGQMTMLNKGYLYYTGLGLLVFFVSYYEANYCK